MRRGRARRPSTAGETASETTGPTASGCGSRSRWTARSHRVPWVRLLANAFGLHDMHGNVDRSGWRIVGTAVTQVRAIGRKRMAESGTASGALCAAVPGTTPIRVFLPSASRSWEHHRLPRQLPLRFPRCPDAFPISLYFFTSWGDQRGAAPPLGGFLLCYRRVSGGPEFAGGGEAGCHEHAADRGTLPKGRANATGAALESHYRLNAIPGALAFDRRAVMRK